MTIHALLPDLVWISISWLVILPLALGWLNVGAQQPSPQQAERLVYRGYARDQRATWQQGAAQLRDWQQAHPDDPEPLYELCLAEYGLIGFDQAQEADHDNLARIERVEQYLDRLDEMGHRPAAIQALRGGLLGMRITEQPLRAMTLGNQSRRLLERAVEVDPQDPAAWVELGNLRYHAPMLFGGDTQQAIDCYQRAIALFERQPDRRQHNWLYLHALAWVGRSHARLDHTDEARQAYKHALAVEPDFRWIKQDLLPALGN